MFNLVILRKCVWGVWNFLHYIHSCRKFAFPSAGSNFFSQNVIKGKLFVMKVNIITGREQDVYNNVRRHKTITVKTKV